jgi:iron complex transport system ATP-binding protein
MTGERASGGLDVADQNEDGGNGRTERAATADGHSALVGENLGIGYPTTDEPVVDVDRIDVPAGEITAVVGPNGSGKSTLLKGFAGQLAPEKGRALLDGRTIAEIDQRTLARELGFLSQESSATSGITVEKLVAHGRYPHRGFFDGLDESDRSAIDRAIDLAGVAHLRERGVSQLSGGQRQLVWIAMVLAQETDTLLLDEPTTFLDLHHQLRVLETVRELNENDGVTVAVVLHDVAQAARFADYVIAMSDGDVYDWGPPTDVVTEELLADVFDVDATVRYDPTLEVVPKRALDQA